MKPKHYTLCLAIAWAFTLSSCGGSSGFSGGTPKGSQPEPPIVEAQDASPPPVVAPQTGEITQEFLVEAKLVPVDIIIGIDTSGSMRGERTYLEQNMQTFMAQLAASQIDAQVTAIGAGFNFPALEPGRFAIVNRPIGSTDAISILTGYFAANVFPLPLRPDSNVEVIIITDDNGLGIGNLAGDFRGPAGRDVFVNAIVGLRLGADPNNPECTIANVGTEYMTLANNTQGNVFDLCVADWSALFMEVSNSIISRTREFALESKPDLAKGFKGTANDREIPPEFITYDEASNTVRISADFNIQVGEKLKITYIAVN